MERPLIDIADAWKIYDTGEVTVPGRDTSFDAAEMRERLADRST